MHACRILLIISLFNSACFLSIDPSYRVDCAPKPGDSKSDCIARGCIWDDNYDLYHPTVPLCYFPTNTGYNIKSESANRLLLQKSSQANKNPYGEDFAELDLTYKQIGSALKVSIGKENRYIPSVPLDENKPIQSAEKLAFNYRDDTVFSFTVARSGANSSTKIWDTSIGGLLFADQYIQIATYLPSDRIYGFGENIHQELKHNFNQYTTWGMLSRDDGPNSKDPTNHNYYGVHPFYLGVESDGKAHGVFIFNSNAQEVTTGPGPHLIYRTIGGQLDIFFFPGPRPEQVLQQYHQLIGRPTLPAYWSLGFQLCRYGYENTDDLQATIKRQQDAGIPIDVAYADIDYMDRYKDFSLGKNWASLPQYMEELHQKGMHMILIFDPAVEVDYDSLKRALQMNAYFIQWPRKDLVPQEVQSLYPMVKDTSIMLGIVWPDRHAAFPDFLDPSGVTNNWWADEFTRYHKQVPFDGIWIDMNEPSNFGTNEDNPFDQFTADHPRIQQLICPVTGNDSYLDVPPYLTASVYKRNESSLCSKTLCMLAKTGGGNLDFYDTRNLYGWSETVATAKAIKQATGRRGAVISRSTFPSSGHYGGHWLGDNTARWEDLRTSIIGSVEFNFFGIPYVGADVCGFLGQSNEELCLRWQQLGAFHSFYRNHNVINQTLQDPAQWKSVAKATREANLFRYQHLPYLYSLHFHASLFGGSVVRPVFFEFPLDSQSYTLSHQFMWGSAVMVVPVISPDVDTVRGYLPGPTASWYSMSNAYQYGSVQPAGYSTFSAPRDTPLPCFVRAGSIILKQRPDMTTTATRTHEFQLLIALTQNSMPKAQGELYWDDGEIYVDDMTSYTDYIHLEYSMLIDTKNTAMLTINCSFGCGSKPSFFIPTLDTIEVFGHAFEPDLTSLKLNGKELKIDASKCSYNKDNQILLIDTPQLIDFRKDAPLWQISWADEKNVDSNVDSSGVARHANIFILFISLIIVRHFY